MSHKDLTQHLILRANQLIARKRTLRFDLITNWAAFNSVSSFALQSVRAKSEGGLPLTVTQLCDVEVTSVCIDLRPVLPAEFIHELSCHACFFAKLSKTGLVMV